MSDYVLMKQVDLHSDQEGYKIILKESPTASRYFIMLVGQGEYSAAAKEMGLLEIPRPLTHELYLALLESLEIQFLRVEIQELKESTYHAKVFCQKEGKEIVLDSRPSDAVTLALNRHIPIFVHQKLLRGEPSREELDHLKEFIISARF
jgi:bifunctional DNase/RNase